jgi:ribosomal protein S18 acetylase RimI-like enzyme
VGLAPATGGLGFGPALVDAVVAWARGRGCGRLVLSVTETNRSARGFYEACGFADTGERRPLREGSDLDVLIFAKTL